MATNMDEEVNVQQLKLLKRIFEVRGLGDGPGLSREPQETRGHGIGVQWRGETYRVACGGNLFRVLGI